MPSDAKKKRAAAKKEAAKKKGQPKPKNDAANAAGDEVEANGVNGATNGDATGQYQLCYIVNTVNQLNLAAGNFSFLIKFEW